MAFFGGVTRSGAWTVPRKLRVWTAFGGAEIDLRDAQFGPGVTEMQVVTIMGGATVIVPTGMQVEVEGIGIMGGFAGQPELGAPRAEPDQPVLRIAGIAVMGGVEVTARLPGESASEARKRQRVQRKALAAARAAKRPPALGDGS